MKRIMSSCQLKSRVEGFIFWSGFDDAVKISWQAKIKSLAADRWMCSIYLAISRIYRHFELHCPLFTFFPHGYPHIQTSIASHRLWITPKWNSVIPPPNFPFLFRLTVPYHQISSHLHEPLASTEDVPAYASKTLHLPTTILGRII